MTGSRIRIIGPGGVEAAFTLGEQDALIVEVDGRQYAGVITAYEEVPVTVVVWTDEAGRENQSFTPPGVETVEDIPDVPAADQLTDRLLEITANLDAHMAAAADRIAAPRIASIEAELQATLDDERTSFKQQLNRADALVAELRRLTEMDRKRIAELRWAARYLPYRLRHKFLRDPITFGSWAGDKPSESAIASIDQLAAEDGIEPYPADTARQA